MDAEAVASPHPPDAVGSPHPPDADAAGSPHPPETGAPHPPPVGAPQEESLAAPLVSVVEEDVAAFDVGVVLLVPGVDQAAPPMGAVPHPDVLAACVCIARGAVGTGDDLDAPTLLAPVAADELDHPLSRRLVLSGSAAVCPAHPEPDGCLSRLSWKGLGKEAPAHCAELGCTKLQSLPLRQPPRMGAPVTGS